MKKLEWELEEELDKGVELWLVGNKKVSKIEFEVFRSPRHIVEDSSWENLRDAIVNLKEAIKGMERIDRTENNF